MAGELVPDGEIARVGDAIAFGHAFGKVSFAVVHGELPLDAEPMPDEELERIRIEAGVPRFGVDYTTDHLPQEAGLTRIVPIDKGCYVGQETVARIHFRGHINKVVRPVMLSAPASVGSAVELDGRKIGTISSVAGSSALAMTPVDLPEETEVDVDGRPAVLGAVPEGTKVKASG
jgi:folate-binding protein YgfZ